MDQKKVFCASQMVPGPCGAGAVLYIPGEAEDILIQKLVTVHGSILLAELVAILVVLEHLIISSSRIKSLRLFGSTVAQW